ncbi:MAG TPA: hypothetical protein PLV21_13465 [Cyclobacteriaceae bacterium]|nr:hypothetical protein [Cyclobacteriaceae bacterium]HRJ82893.1 hypothetical protein [Cyclobacteriaceae bacterium]
MTPQPDNLFRDKLEHFQLKPSPEAWNRIEAGLTKPARKSLWLKIAAGLVLLSVASVILWNITPKQDNVITAQQDNTVESTPGEVKVLDKNIATENLLAEEKEQISTPALNKKHKEVIISHNTPVALIETQPEESLPALEILTTETLLAQTDNTEAESAAGVYLVLTADEVNQKYLKPLPEQEATNEDKKSSRIQMLMSVAHNLKNGEHALGDLRQKKDEIFALNFIDEKKHESKKN